MNSAAFAANSYLRSATGYLQHVLRHGAAHFRTSIEVHLGREAVQVSRWTQMLTPKLINILEGETSISEVFFTSEQLTTCFLFLVKQSWNVWLEHVLEKVLCHSDKAQMSKARCEKMALQQQDRVN